MLSSNPKPKLLFLYSELADYFIACLRKLTGMYEVEVHVMHWPVNKEAPFTFDFPGNVKFYNRGQFSLKELKEKVDSIEPDFIYCSGWMDKDYMKAAKKYKNKIPVVIGLDTKWEGTLKQRFACLISLFTIRNVFSHSWVPGQQQKEYALRLGFNEDKILTGYYCADVDYFKTIREKAKIEKEKSYPHRLVFAGRYYEFKGIKDLWDTFIKWQDTMPNDWELWCLGTGDIEPVVHPKIKHFGFVQPRDMEPYIKGAGVFVMPSHFEPWGVVLHEFTSAGLPVICSDKVGATEAFLKDGENGYIYQSGDVNGLLECLKKITSLPDEKLLQMGDKSAALALQITPAIWADKLMNLLKRKK